MGGADDLTDVERQLLTAALIHGLGPATSLGRANTLRVVNQVLQWRGLTAEEIDSGWRTEDTGSQHETVYAALVHMVHQACRDGGFRPSARPGPALFEGGGNWGVPGDPDHPACLPHFNSCRLTPEGERLARQLLEQRSEKSV
jgi:hypothetical protein